MNSAIRWVDGGGCGWVIQEGLEGSLLLRQDGRLPLPLNTAVNDCRTEEPLAVNGTVAPRAQRCCCC
jgi:hypothetical protein